MGCKSTITYHQEVFETTPQRKVPVKTFTQKEKSDKVVLLLPDFPDTVAIAQTEALRLMRKAGYDIILTGKPGEDVSTIGHLDNREQRLQDLITVFQHYIHDRYQHYIIMGIGEGAYLVPALHNLTEADTSIAVNMNPYSPLHGYESLLSSDSLSPAEWRIVYNTGASTLNELRVKLERVKKDGAGPDRLYPNKNQQWMSYYKNPVLEDVTVTTKPLYWINFEHYPMISAAHQKEVALFCKVPYASFILLPGNGNLNKEESAEQLAAAIKNIIALH